MRTQHSRNDACALVQPDPPVSLEARCSSFTSRPARDARDRYQIAIRITHVDRAILRGYLRQYHFAHRTEATPRLAWIAGENLPRGTQMQPLPADLERMLSALPAGYQRVLSGRDVLLVRVATREIIDVMRDACGTVEDHAGRRRIRLAIASRCSSPAREDAAARWRLYDRVAVL